MKTSEMYAYAENHPDAKFRRAKNEYIYHFNELGELICGGIGAVSVPQLNEEWELVREPVDFLTSCGKKSPASKLPYSR